MEALTLAVGVSVLVETKQFRNFVKQDSGLRVIQEASRLIMNALPEKSQGMTRVFGASLLDGACLPSIGGLSEADIRFLVDQLWADRKALFKLQGRRRTYGWSCDLLMLWHCACFIM